MNKRIKIVLTGLVAAIAIPLILLTASMPSILSTDWGTQQLVQAVNARIQGELSIKKLSLSWFTRQLIEDLTLKDAERENTVVSFDLFSTNQPLWKILWSGFDVAHSKLANFNAYVVQNSQGGTNLDQALASPDFLYDYEASAYPPILLKNFNGAINIPSDSDITAIELTGETEQGGLKGAVDIKGKYIGKLSRDFWRAQHIDGVIQINNFPVAIADQILALSNAKIAGLLTAIAGPSLNVIFDGNYEGDKAYAHCNLESSNLNINFKGMLDPNLFTLEDAGEAKFKMTPEFISFLAEHRYIYQKLRLKEPVIISVLLKQLNLPYINHVLDTQNVTLNLSMNLAPAEIFGTSLPSSLIVKNVNSSLSILPENEMMDFTFNGEVAADSKKSLAKIHALVEKPLSLDDLKAVLWRNAELYADFVDLPIYSINDLFQTAFPLAEALGNYANLNLAAKTHEGRLNANLSVSSDKVRFDHVDLSFADQALHLAPFKLNYHLSPHFANEYLLPSQLVTLENDVHLKFDVDALETPIDISNKDPIALDLNVVALNEIKMSAGLGAGSFSIENATLDLVGNSLDKIICHLSAGLISQKTSGVVWSVVGKHTQVNAGATVHVRENHQIDLIGIKALVEGQALNLDLHADYFDGKLSLTTPASLKFVLNPEQLPVGLLPQEVALFNTPTSLFFTIAPPDKPWDPQIIETLSFSGDLSSSPLHMIIEGQELIVNDLLIPWEVNGREDKIKLGFSGTTLIPPTNKYGTFKGRYSLKEWALNNRVDFSKASHRFEASLVDFPAEPLSFYDTKETLADLIGSRFNADLDVQYKSGDKSGLFDLSLFGNQLEVDAALTFSDVLELKDPNRPAKLSMVITPERFLALQHILRKSDKANYTLLSPAKFDLSVSYIKLPWIKSDGTATFPYWHSGIKAELFIDKMVLNDTKRAQKLPFNRTVGTFDSRNLSKTLTFNVRAEPHQEEGFQGTMDISGTADDLFTSDGRFNLESLSLDLKVKASQLETFAFCHIFCPFPNMAEKVEALLGNPLNADIEANIVNMNGPVKAILTGTAGKASLDGLVSNGIFTLKKAFTAEVQASPKLGKYVLRDIAPLFAALESSSQPITFVIDAENFKFPMKQFDLKNIEIGLCTIAMGKMLFRNEGEIKTVLGLLGNNTNKLVPAWVTPLYVHMNNGKITLERVDMLLGNLYPIAAWGIVDLDKDKVAMVIGISGTALKNALGVSSVDANYMLQIPLKGTLDNVKIDKKKAAARISSLALQGQGTKGAVLGTILDIASGGLSESKVPPPTTNPLPWASSN